MPGFNKTVYPKHPNYLLIPIVISSIILIFSLNFFMLLTNNSFFDKTLKHTGSYERLGQAQATKINNNIINYLNSGSESLPKELTGKEKSHLADVKQLIFRLKLISYFALAVLVICLLFYFQRPADHIKAALARLFMYIGSFGLLIVSLFAIASCSFNFSFMIFHQLLFTGNWQFPATSLLIQLYAQQFFFQFFSSLLLHATTSFILLIAAGFLIKHYSNCKRFFFMLKRKL